jgi:hypothetical protein
LIVPVWRHQLLAMTLCAMGCHASAAQETPSKPTLPPLPANGERGYVLTDFSYAIYPGAKENCPNGAAADLHQDFLDTLPADERARLTRPENEKEYHTRAIAYGFGPSDTNVCTSYDRFPNRSLIRQTVQSKIAYGLNLDGDDTDGARNPKGCAHENFTSPTGEKGIDNQAYRALGCWVFWRKPDGSIGEMTDYMQQHMATGDQTVVMLLRGLDSLENDDDVEVIVASTLNVPALDAQGKIQPDTSFEVSDNPRWRNVLHGRVKNGVLTTEPADIVLRRAMAVGGQEGREVEWMLYGARLRISFKADGSLDGILGTYEPFQALIQDHILAGAATVRSGNVDCATQYNTLQKLADGRRDPNTGKCTAISSAHLIKAIPAFVFDRTAKTAQLDDRAK